MPKQSFAPDANAAARRFLHLCIRKFPEKDFSLSPRMPKAAWFDLSARGSVTACPHRLCAVGAIGSSLNPIVGLVHAKSRPQEELYW